MPRTQTRSCALRNNSTGSLSRRSPAAKRSTVLSPRSAVAGNSIDCWIGLPRMLASTNKPGVSGGRPSTPSLNGSLTSAMAKVARLSRSMLACIRVIWPCHCQRSPPKRAVNVTSGYVSMLVSNKGKANKASCDSLIGRSTSTRSVA